MKNIKEINSIEEALELRDELAQELQKCNQLIFEEDESVDTVEFSEKYNQLKKDFNEIEEILLQNHYKEPKTTDSILNEVSLWIWPYMIALIILAFYPIFKLIDISIMIKFISIPSVTEMNTTNQIIVLICASLIFPAVLLMLNLIPNFLLKKKENKKVYFIMSLIFWISLFISTAVIIIMYVVLPFVK